MNRIFLFILFFITQFVIAQGTAMKNILLVYGSQKGSTAEIVDSMQTYLKNAKCNVNIMPAADRLIDFSGYDLIIIGSGIYSGHPHKNIIAFINVNRKELQQRKIAVFASCGNMASKNTKIRKKASRKYSNTVACGLDPFKTAVFAGKIPDYGWFMNIISCLVTATKPGDYRNWEAIKNWTISLLDT